jgi:tetratricopeptide (TPR) repeat protein
LDALDRRGRSGALRLVGHSVRWGAVGLLLLTLGLAGCRGGPPPTGVERGDAALAAGDLVAAADYYEQASQQDPHDVRAWHGRAEVARQSGDPEASLGFYVQVARRDRAYLSRQARLDYTTTLIQAGHERLRAGRTDGAVRALKAARNLTTSVPAIDTDLGRALTARGARLSMLGQRKRALADFREAIELTPGEAEPYVGAAQILLASGRREEALDLLGTARRHHPSDLRVRALTIEAVGLR